MVEEVFREIRNQLPPIEYVENVLSENAMERTINQSFYEIINGDRAALDAERTQNAFIMVDACRDDYV